MNAAEIMIRIDKGLREVRTCKSQLIYAGYVDLHLLGSDFFGSQANMLKPFGHPLEVIAKNQIEIFVAMY